MLIELINNKKQKIEKIIEKLFKNKSLFKEEMKKLPITRS
jgi:hypothetical protein